MNLSTLNENQVVEAVARHLQSTGAIVTQQLTTMQQGIDIIAYDNGVEINVEAKGSTSSKVGTKLYGTKTGMRGDIPVHVPQAITTALRAVGRGVSRSYVAFPNDEAHRYHMRDLEFLVENTIGVFWVNEDYTVISESPWEDNAWDTEQSQSRVYQNPN